MREKGKKSDVQAATPMYLMRKEIIFCLRTLYGFRKGEDSNSALSIVCLSGFSGQKWPVIWVPDVCPGRCVCGRSHRWKAGFPVRRGRGVSCSEWSAEGSPLHVREEL